MNLLARLDGLVLPRLGRVVGRVAARPWALPALLVASGVAMVAAAGIWVGGANSSASASDAAPNTAVLGPATGESLAVYQRAAASRLAAMVSANDPSTYALVDFTSYETPDQVAVLTKGLLLPLAYVRAQVAGVATSVYPVRVSGASELASVLTALAKRSRVEAIDEGEVASLPGAKIPAAKAAALRARISGFEAEARVFAPGCACIFAAVVYGSPAQLLGLAHESGVRVVDPAPSYVPFDGLAVQWLLPQTTGRFPGLAHLPGLLTVP